MSSCFPGAVVAQPRGFLETTVFATVAELSSQECIGEGFVRGGWFLDELLPFA